MWYFGLTITFEEYERKLIRKLKLQSLGDKKWRKN